MTVADWSKKILGEYSTLLLHVGRATLAFVIVLVCLYVARQAVPIFFPPGELLGNLLHLVDVYAALLGTVGYIVWITLDVYFLFRERLLKARFLEGGDDARVR